MKTWTSVDRMGTLTPTLMTGHTTQCGRLSSRNQRKAMNGLIGDKGQAGHGSGAAFVWLAAQLPQLPEVAVETCQKNQAPTPWIGSRHSFKRSVEYRCL